MTQLKKGSGAGDFNDEDDHHLHHENSLDGDIHHH